MLLITPTPTLICSLPFLIKGNSILPVAKSSSHPWLLLYFHTLKNRFPSKELFSLPPLAEWVRFPTGSGSPSYLQSRLHHWFLLWDNQDSFLYLSVFSPGTTRGPGLSGDHLSSKTPTITSVLLLLWPFPAFLLCLLEHLVSCQLSAHFFSRSFFHQFSLSWRCPIEM